MPKKIKVNYKGEIKLDSSSLFSQSMALWVNVLGYLTCRGWTFWKFQIPTGFWGKSMQLVHTGEKWEYFGTRNILLLDIFASTVFISIWWRNSFHQAIQRHLEIFSTSLYHYICRSACVMKLKCTMNIFQLISDFCYSAYGKIVLIKCTVVLYVSH